tara:strand:- start:3103 stop:4365 length:1263 start_codon:yes stop_codon:yes gene_type:complete
MQNNKINIINLGCRLNIYEGEVIKSLVDKNNLKNYTIINSCAVTEEAEKKVKYEIRKSKKKFPNNKIILTGCAAQISPNDYASIKDVNFVIGNHEKLQSNTWGSLTENNPINVRDIFSSNEINKNIVEKFEGKSRAFIEIQQGCDHRCTFCVIPYGRGNNRSVPVGIIIDRIKTIVKKGYNEVVLTGVDITDYGKDLPGKPNLFQLVRRILNLVQDLKHLRLSSIDCAEITNDFWPLLNDKRLMPYFHISMQSGSDLILKRMKRRHNRQQAIEFCNKVKSIRKDAVFGADLIAGFPTENENMFEKSVELIEECQLTHLHVFPYSKRKFTPATFMPQLPKEIIKKRAKILREKGKEKLLNYLNKQIGLNDLMLVEYIEKNISYGKTQHYTKVKVNEPINEGKIVKCKITNIDNDVLEAVLV